MKKTIKLTNSIQLCLTLFGIFGLLFFKSNHTLYIGMGFGLFTIALEISLSERYKDKGKIHNPFLIFSNGNYYNIEIDIDSCNELKCIYIKEGLEFKKRAVFKYIGRNEGFMIFDFFKNEWKHYKSDEVWLTSEGSKVKGRIVGNKFIVNNKSF